MKRLILNVQLFIVHGVTSMYVHVRLMLNEKNSSWERKIGPESIKKNYKIKSGNSLWPVLSTNSCYYVHSGRRVVNLWCKSIKEIHKKKKIQIKFMKISSHLLPTLFYFWCYFLLLLHFIPFQRGWHFGRFK